MQWLWWIFEHVCRIYCKWARQNEFRSFTLVSPHEKFDTKKNWENLFTLLIASWRPSFGAYSEIQQVINFLLPYQHRHSQHKRWELDGEDQLLSNVVQTTQQLWEPLLWPEKHLHNLWSLRSFVYLQAFPSSSCSHIYVYLLSDIPVYIISFPNTYFLPTHNIFLHIYPSIPRFMISI